MSEQNYNFHEILPPTLNWNFVKYRGIAAVLSTLGIIVAVALMVFVGPNWGIDFTGGTEVQVHMTTKTEVSEVREVLVSSGVGDEAIQEAVGEGIDALTDISELTGDGREHDEEVERLLRQVAIEVERPVHLRREHVANLLDLQIGQERIRDHARGVDDPVDPPEA